MTCSLKEDFQTCQRARCACLQHAGDLSLENRVRTGKAENERERGLNERERGLDERERGLNERERGLDERERGLNERERVGAHQNWAPPSGNVPASVSSQLWRMSA